jgi:cytidylate kinase
LELYGIDLGDMSPYTLIVYADDKDEEEVFSIVKNELEGN